MLKAFGSFGSAIWQGIKGRAQPVVEALRIGREAEREVAAADVWREYRKIIKLEGISEQLATLAPGEYVPTQLWQESEIPWKQRFAYEVTISGRDIATGRFARTQRILTFSRELTAAEVLEESTVRFGKEGAYPQMDITHLSLTGAFSRAGEGLI